MSDKKESKSKVYTIPVRSIVANTNPRNPLSKELQEQGFEVFGDKGVWRLAFSDDPTHRRQFVQLMQEFDEEFCQWASTFLTQGQLQAVEVRDNGSDKYTLVYGCRRCLAILYNWCLTGKPAEPVVEAKLVKGSNGSLLHRAIVENLRRNPNLLEEAQAVKLALNNGQTKEEIAKEQGVTKKTIENRLKLLDLDPKLQNKVKEGKLTVTKALEAARNGKEPPEGGEEKKPRTRSRKTLEEVLAEYAETTPEHRVISWVLGLREELR